MCLCTCSSLNQPFLSKEKREQQVLQAEIPQSLCSGINPLLLLQKMLLLFVIILLMIFNDFPQSLPFLCVSGVLKSLFGCFHLLFFCLFSFLQLKKIFNNFNKTSVTHCINWTTYQTKQTGYTTLLDQLFYIYN